MLTALIIVFIVFLLWKLTPVVFRVLEIRKQFKADVEIRRIDMARKREKEAAEGVKKAEDEYQVHLKRVQESVGHQGRVQYPWVSGIRTNLDSETNKEFIGMRGELAKDDHEAQQHHSARFSHHITTEEDLVGECSISKKGLDALKKLFEEEGP